MAAVEGGYDPQLGMIVIFRNRLKHMISVAPVLDYIHFLSDEVKVSIRARLEARGQIEAADHLLAALEKGPRPPGWFQEFATALERTQCSGARQYLDPSTLPTPSLEARNDAFQQLLTLMSPSIIDKLTQDEVTECFQKHLCDQENYERIMTKMAQAGVRAGARELLSVIVQKQNWFSPFLDILRTTGLKDIADELSVNVDFNPEEKEELKGDQAKAKSDGMEDFPDPSPDSSIEEASVLTESDQSLTDSTSNSMNGSLEQNGDSGNQSEPEDQGESRRRGSPEPIITLRDYQKEVAQPALEGENVLICLPTGSGKTRVAVYITKKHLDARKRNGSSGKVMVLVNKVPLVEQHYRKEFEPYLKHWYTVTKISGDSQLKISFPQVVGKNDVVICTAQILENSLNKASSGEDGVHLADFSLIIIDECHHTQKEGVYNNIMTRYIRLKMKNKKLNKENLPQKPLPQILGLTASPGVGGATTIQRAQQHILKICANLDASKIMTVQKHLNQLKTQVKEPYKNVVITEDSRENPFRDQIVDMMTQIQSHASLAPTPEFGTQSYEQWVVQKEKNAAKDPNRRERVCAEHLKKYNDALLINDTIRMIDAFNHLNNFYNEKKMKREQNEQDGDLAEQNIYETDRFLSKLFSDNEKALRAVAGNPKYENKKLEQLSISIHKEFTKTDDEPRGIIFTKTRQSAMALLEWINENKKFEEELGVKADYLIGAGSNSEFRPMTQNKQKEVINKFSVGKVNLLVATNVAEEGLDIKECKFVIRYGTVTNEIAMMQARGRARADDSSYILVASSTSGVKEREDVNEYREKMMYKAIDSVQNMTHEDYRRKITEFQMQSVLEKKMKTKKKNCKKYEAEPSLVTFHCRNCHEELCTGQDIKVIENMHHVIIAPEFAKRYVKRELANNEGKEEILCAKCSQEWGPMMVHHGLDLPCLKIKNCVVKYKDQKKQPPPFKQWSELKIRFPQFEMEDVDISDDEEED